MAMFCVGQTSFHLQQCPAPPVLPATYLHHRKFSLIRLSLPNLQKGFGWDRRIQFFAVQTLQIFLNRWRDVYPCITGSPPLPQNILFQN